MNAAPVMLTLYGPMRLDLPEGANALRYAKGRALLAFLALHRDQWVARRTLAALLWPALEESRALTNLRQVLAPLQRVLGQDGAALGLRAERDRLMLQAHEGLVIDACLLTAPVPDLSDETARQQLMARLPQAGQPFLADLCLPECPDFETWRTEAAASLRDRHRGLLRQLHDAQRAAGQLEAAVGSARQALALDPLDEASAARLMQLLLQLGDRRGAEQVLAQTDQLLVRELGHRASPELRRLVDTERPAPAGIATAGAAPSRWERRHLALLWIQPPPTPDTDEAWHALAAQLDAVRAQMQRWGARCLSGADAGLLAVFGLRAEGEAPEWRALLAAQDLLGHWPADADAPVAGLPGLALDCGPERLRFQASHWQLMSRQPEGLRTLACRAGPGELLLGPGAVERLADRVCCDEPGIDDPSGARRWRGLRGLDPAALPSRACLGRELPLQDLRLHWLAACRGQPAWVILRGEAGIGKTTLAASFARSLEGSSALRLSWSCRLEWQHQPLAPLRECLQRLPAPVQALLPARLQQLLEGQVVPGPALFDACFAWLDRLSARQPVLLWVDDLHWADQATRELLARYAAWMDRQRLLILVSSRPEVVLESAGADPVCMDVQPLSAPAAQQLLQSLDAQGRLGSARRASILEAAAGIPLLIEAMVQGELDGRPSAGGGIVALMQAELDRLGINKPVLQAAALIGPRFDAALLAELLAETLPATAVAQALQRAAECRLVVQEDGARASGDGVYRFRHALLHEAAAQGALPAQTRPWHARLAELRARRGEAPGLLARHLAGAGHLEAACQAWWQAGQQALRQEFAADAQASLEEASRLAVAGPAGDARARWRLDLDRVRALQMHEGYGSAEAHRLCRQLLAAAPDEDSAAPSSERLRFVALSRLYMGAGSQGESGGLRVARQLEEEALTDAERLTACFALGNSLFWRGRFEEARHCQRQGLALLPGLDAEARRQHLGDDAAVLLLAVHCWTLWFCGDGAGADAAVEQGLALARQEGRNHGLCFMLTFAAAMNWTRGRPHPVLRHAGEALALATRLGYPLWQGMNGLFLAWARVRTGHAEVAAQVLQAAEQADRAYKAGRSTARWILASTLELLKQHELALKLLHQALPDALEDEDHYCRPGLLMLLSDCERRAGDWSRAQTLASEACALAREQGAVGWLARHAPALAQELTRERRTNPV